MRVVETVPTHLAGQFSHHQSHQQNTGLTSLQNSSQSMPHTQTTIQQSSLDTTLTTTIGPFSPPEQPSSYFFFSALSWSETLNILFCFVFQNLLLQCQIHLQRTTITRPPSQQFNRLKSIHHLPSIPVCLTHRMSLT